MAGIGPWLWRWVPFDVVEFFERNPRDKGTLPWG